MTQAIILFVDNDPDFLATRAEFLENEGYRVVKATSPAQADQILRSTIPHLAIFDIRLVNDDDEKDISGLILAKTPAHRNIPKIILTGFPSTDAARETLRQGADGTSTAIDFLSKSEKPDAMVAAVNRALAVSMLRSSKGGSATPSRKSRSMLVAFVLLLGAVVVGVFGIVYSDPRWLVGTAALGILFAIFTWQLAVD